ncbi:SusD/RagB family nutrient-binding outer membrane lipoprotein [Tenuifilum thalassicum]|nr:SusD/RagB family nutrient-binding outer membrane lipoprotein [Tenuifilum thalassicum]
MKSIKFKYLIALTFVVTLGNSCTKDFEEINKNPNAIDITKEYPDKLLANAIEGIADQVFDVWLGHEIGSCWVQHMAKVQYTDEDRYVPRNDVINSVWNWLYAGPGMETQRLYEMGEHLGNQNYQGVALVLKSYIFSVLTDLYGDIPYKEAFKIDSILMPKFDQQEFVYIDLINKLKYANSILLEDGTPIEGDILFNGDINKWRRFANSLRLRLLMRMSYQSEYHDFIREEINSMISDAASNPLISKNSENAALIFLGSYPNNHPLNETYKTRDDHRVSKTLIDAMYNPNNHDHPDWRIVVYAETPEAGGYWIGLPNGLTSAKAAAYLGNGITRTSKLGEYFRRADAPGMFISRAEVCFLLAEASYRGLLTVGTETVQDYYEMGIKESYNQFASEIVSKVPDYYSDFIGISTTVDDFYNDYMANGGAWDATKALEKIYTQKWIAMFDQGLQAWFEWRRTGYPQLTPAEDGLNNGRIPQRLRYPSDEYSRNGKKLTEAITRQGEDDLNTRVWWDVADN